MKRIVLKVGSSSLVTNNNLAQDKIELVSQFVHSLTIDYGYEVVLVTSGAVAAGRSRLNPKLVKSLPAIHLKQAAAAVGQQYLIEAYRRYFDKHKITIAQILLTRRDFVARSSYNNALTTFNTLLDSGILPIVNENDSVRWAENNFGDNDLLAALISALIHAEQLIILTDIDGLYPENPYDEDGKLKLGISRINTVIEVNQDILKLGGNPTSSVGTGGMRSKLVAAQKALVMGVPVFIGKADNLEELKLILSCHGHGTYFGNKNVALTNRKIQWIAFHSEVKGRLIVDGGARDALILNQRSLLPAGVVAIEGEFINNDVVEVLSQYGEFLGRGITNYTKYQLELAKGKSTAQAKKLLNIGRDEVIHRDNWVTLTFS
jgi:glutamate 5-kinase